MTRLLEWLLDLENIRLGRDAPLILTWGRGAETWLLFCLAVVIVVGVTLVHRRESTSMGRRLALAVLRCTTIALVVAIICQPSLVLQRNRVEPSYVALAVDTSLSMAARDRYLDADLGSAIARGTGVANAGDLINQSRLDLVKAALMRSEGAPLSQLLERNELQFYSFAGAVEPHGRWTSLQHADTQQSPVATLVDSIAGVAADGNRTDLAGAISQLLDSTQGRRLAAIVLATDGQTTESTSIADALDLARDRRIPVFPIRIGSTQVPVDINVGPLRAQESVFVNDLLAIEARLTANGLAERTQVSLRLIDEKADATIATADVTLDPADAERTVEFMVKPTRAGHVRYRVEGEPVPGEQTTDNNADHVEVTVVDNRLRVLYVDAYPRYEYRYLKNALVREETMELSVLLLEADEAFVQEGTLPIRRFPETPEELNRFDVVLFGDVDPRGGWLAASQMTMLLDFVGNEGGGFGVIAGERSAPQRFLGTPLEKLIPVRIDTTAYGHYSDTMSSGFRPHITVDGQRSRILRFATDLTRGDTDREEPEGGDADSSHDDPFETLPELYWLARTLGPKPGASVLVEHPTMPSQGDSHATPQLMPLVVVGRYGAGRIFFQATDDTWRWRQHTGELLHDTYWVQIARSLMKPQRLTQDRRFIIRTDRESYMYGSPAHVQLEIADMQLLAVLGERIDLTITEQHDTGVDRSAAPAAQPSPRSAGDPQVAQAAPGQSIVARVVAHRLGPGSNLYETTVIPRRPGSYSIAAETIAPDPGERSASASIRVERPQLEARHIAADHDALERIAQATGGKVIDLDELETAFGQMPERSVQIPDDITEPLWDSKLVLIMFGLLISTEWILRKTFGLV